MSHTPGPWVYSHDEARGMSEHDDPKGARMIEAGMHTLLDGTKYYPGTPDNEADWYLIAAAPDLLSAATAVLATCPCDPDINPIWQAAWDALVTAIAKAEGR